MAAIKIMLTAFAVTVTMTFFYFVQKAYSMEEPNTPAEKARRVERSRKNEDRVTGQRMKQRMAELSEQLNLTDEQKKAIRPIIENEIKEIQALRADTSLSKEEKIEKMKTIRQTAQEAMNKILTPEQQVKLAEAKEETKEAVQEDITPFVQKRMMSLNEKLSLTDEQKKTIQPIIENEIKELSAVRNDETLSKEQRFEKTKTIRQMSHEEIKKVLTPEQQAKLEEIKERGRPRRAERKITDGNDRN